jgi:NADH-quinone oxidoreductase subunit F
LAQIYARLEEGHGGQERSDPAKPGASEADIDKLLDISDAILGKSFCALGDGAASPILSSIQYFRDEYLAHLDGGCPFDPLASMLAAPEGVGV